MRRCLLAGAKHVSGLLGLTWASLPRTPDASGLEDCSSGDLQQASQGNVPVSPALPSCAGLGHALLQGGLRHEASTRTAPARETRAGVAEEIGCPGSAGILLM